MKKKAIKDLIQTMLCKNKFAEQRTCCILQ